MEFGIFDHVESRAGATTAQILQDRLVLARLAEEVGCFCYHVSEHHGTPLSNAPSPHLLLAAVAAQTTTLRLGPLGSLLPFYEPLRLVEEVCMLDQLSAGRLEMGLGRGVSRIEMKFYNIDMDESRARFDEALAVLRLGLTNDVLEYSGQYYDYDHVPMVIKPFQQPHPPFWYPTSNLNSVPWVAESGYNAIFAGELDHIAEQVTVFKDVADPGQVASLKYGIHPFIVVAPTEEEAMTVGEESYRSHHDNLSHLSFWQGRESSMTRKQNLSAPPTLREAVEQGWAAAGTPEAVIDQLGTILGKTGCNYVLYTPLAGNTPVPFAARALELFGRRIIPALTA